MTADDGKKNHLNTRLGNNIRSARLRSRGKTLRRSLASITLIGSICVLLLMLVFGT